jgi:divalent metal cation (Fe/Co/Zn/Cd) transporter
MKRNDNPETSVERGTRPTVLGICVNLELGSAKCAAGLLGNSFALVADGVESITDVLRGSVVCLAFPTHLCAAHRTHPFAKPAKGRPPGLITSAEDSESVCFQGANDA